MEEEFPLLTTCMSTEGALWREKEVYQLLLLQSL